MKRSEKGVGWRILNMINENEVEMVGHIKLRDENSILTRVMELKVEGRRPVGRPKKTWSKVVEEDNRKLNITENTVEDRNQWRQLISRPTPGVIN